MKKREMMMVNIRDLIASSILIAMGATANAQLVDDSEQGPFKAGSITYEGPGLYWFDEEIEFCPSTCYTDVIQSTVIRCEATNGPVDDQPPIDDRGEFVGTVPRWRIQEHHMIVERSIREDDCHRSVQDTVIQDLGNQPMYLPGDPDILDTRTPRDLGLQPFDCNDLYPKTIDNTQTPPIVSTKLEFDLLIERVYFTCH
jgi:hypothetical protein